MLRIATGTATGSLSQIAFYSDAGQTYLGEGGFVGTTIVPVPEPTTIAMAFAAVICGGFLRRCRLSRRQEMANRETCLP